MPVTKRLDPSLGDSSSSGREEGGGPLYHMSGESLVATTYWRTDHYEEKHCECECPRRGQGVVNASAHGTLADLRGFSKVRLTVSAEGAYRRSHVGRSRTPCLR